MPRSYFHVAPRFTSGSPAQVDEATARRVAAQERDARARYSPGDPLPSLEAIAYVTTEKGAYMYVEDLLTEARYRVPLRWWGVEGHDRRSTSWHKRQDRAQFRLFEGLTPFERAGKRYGVLGA